MQALRSQQGLVVPLLWVLSACPSSTGTTTVPVSCEDDRILISAGGQRHCGATPAYQAELPTCGTATAGVLSSDGKTLCCGSADYGLGQALSSTAATSCAER